jgi:hypothetical protein
MPLLLVDMVHQAGTTSNAQGCYLSDTCVVAKHALLMLLGYGLM